MGRCCVWLFLCFRAVPFQICSIFKAPALLSSERKPQPPFISQTNARRSKPRPLNTHIVSLNSYCWSLQRLPSKRMLFWYMMITPCWRVTFMVNVSHKNLNGNETDFPLAFQVLMCSFVDVDIYLWLDFRNDSTTQPIWPHSELSRSKSNLCSDGAQHKGSYASSGVVGNDVPRTRSFKWERRNGSILASTGRTERITCYIFQGTRKGTALLAFILVRIVGLRFRGVWFYFLFAARVYAGRPGPRYPSLMYMTMTMTIF